MISNLKTKLLKIFIIPLSTTVTSTITITITITIALTLTLTLTTIYFNITNVHSAESSTIYGMIKKEMRYFCQDSEASARTMYGPKDVDGVESRFGFKGNYNLSTLNLNIGYKLETGINSSRDNKAASNITSSGVAGDERIRVRNSVITLSHDYFGKLFLGQDNTPGVSRNTDFDPLYGTTAEIIAADLTVFVGAINGNTFNHPIMPRNTFYNQLAYETPSFLSGFRLAIAHDKNNQTLIQKNSGDDVQQWWTYAVYFDKEMSFIKLAATGVYANQFKEGVVYQEQKSFWQLFTKAEIKQFSIGVGFYQTQVNKNNKNNSVSAIGTYNPISDLTLAITYYKTRLSNYATAPAVLGTTGSQQQIATGLIYKLNANVKAHFTFALLERRWNFAPTGVFPKSQSKISNDATNTSIGITVNF